jgi:hypothetical protein
MRAGSPLACSSRRIGALDSEDDGLGQTASALTRPTRPAATLCTPCPHSGIIAAVHPLRLARALMVATTALAAAVAGTLGGAAGGCHAPIPDVWVCMDPNGGRPYSMLTYNLVCPCTCCVNGPVVSGPYPEGDCLWLDAGADGGDAGGTHAGDAGQGGAPPGTCTGECLPSAPLGWMGPELLLIASSTDEATCPDAGLSIAYAGYGSVTTATTCSCTLGWACQGTPSGTCPDGVYCAAFGAVSGALTCISYDYSVDFDCPNGSPYSDKHVFYYAGGDAASTCTDGTPTCTVNPVQPVTFCCLN